MIIELKTKTRLISNRRNRMLLTLVSPVWTGCGTVNFRFILSTEPTFNQLEQAVQFKNRLGKTGQYTN